MAGACASYCYRTVRRTSDATEAGGLAVESDAVHKDGGNGTEFSRSARPREKMLSNVVTRWERFFGDGHASQRGRGRCRSGNPQMAYVAVRSPLSDGRVTIEPSPWTRWRSGKRPEKTRISQSSGTGTTAGRWPEKWSESRTSIIQERSEEAGRDGTGSRPCVISQRLRI